VRKGCKEESSTSEGEVTKHWGELRNAKLLNWISSDYFTKRGLSGKRITVGRNGSKYERLMVKVQRKKEFDKRQKQSLENNIKMVNKDIGCGGV
jgi:hypothetical protein